MPSSARLLEKGFWGLAGPSSGRAAKAVLIGSGGPFFEAVLEGSSQVETYDEEYRCEAYRRGIRTEEASASAAAARLEALRGSFPFLLGYRAWPSPAGKEGDDARVVLSHDGAEAGRLSPGDVLVGPRCRLTAESGRSGPFTVTAQEVWAGKGRGRVLPKKGAAPILVIDPLVMDPGLFPAPENIEPGGLAWYALTSLLKELFDGRRVRGALVRPCRLPRRDPVPAFVLARLVSRILTAAVICGGRRR